MIGDRERVGLQILRYLPPHEYYCELWAGDMSLFFQKPRLKTEVYNDTDNGIVDFFRILREPKMMCEFHEAFLRMGEELTPIVENAYGWFEMIRRNFSSRVIRDNQIEADSWVSVLKSITIIYDRFKTVQVEAYPWQKILNIYNLAEYLIFADIDGNQVDINEFSNAAEQYDGMIVLVTADENVANVLCEGGWNRHFVKHNEHDISLLRNLNCINRIEKGNLCL